MWIDSLCIIQGSEQDWRAEFKTMHLVYRNALCTLAAAEAGKLEDGFIDIAKPAVKTEFLLLLELHGKAEEFMVIYDSARFLQSRIPKWSLMNRGWALQASLLSRRAMYFGTPLIWSAERAFSPAVMFTTSNTSIPSSTEKDLAKSPRRSRERPWALGTGGSSIIPVRLHKTRRQTCGNVRKSEEDQVRISCWSVEGIHRRRPTLDCRGSDGWTPNGGNPTCR